MRKTLAIALMTFAMMTAGAWPQGINLLGQEAGDATGEWYIACSWTARDKQYKDLKVGECVVTQSVHMPDAMDHWVEYSRSWGYCVAWMQKAGVPGW